MLACAFAVRIIKMCEQRINFSFKCFLWNFGIFLAWSFLVFDDYEQFVILVSGLICYLGILQILFSKNLKVEIKVY